MARECANGSGKQRGASSEDLNGDAVGGEAGTGWSIPIGPAGWETRLQSAEREGPLAPVRPERSGR